MMVKKAKHSTLPEEITKARSAESEVTEKDLIHFTNALIEWARDDSNALDPVEFALKKWGLPLGTYKDWIRRYSIVKEARETALEYIGLRRDKLWLDRIHTSGADKWIPAFKELYRTMKEDDKRFDHKLSLEKISHQAKEGNLQGETKIVILKEYPDAKEIK